MEQRYTDEITREGTRQGCVRVVSRKETICEVEGQGPDDATVWVNVPTKVPCESLVASSRHYRRVVEFFRGLAAKRGYTFQVSIGHLLSLWFLASIQELVSPPCMPCLATSSKKEGWSYMNRNFHKL